MGWERAEVQGRGSRKARSVQPQLFCVRGRNRGWVVSTPWKSPGNPPGPTYPAFQVVGQTQRTSHPLTCEGDEECSYRLSHPFLPFRAYTSTGTEHLCHCSQEAGADGGRGGLAQSRLLEVQRSLLPGL